VKSNGLGLQCIDGRIERVTLTKAEISMNMKSPLATATLVAFVVVSATAFAADDSAVAAKSPVTDAAQSTQSVQQPPAAQKMKLHSHVQEKTGFAPSAAPAPTPEEKAAMDKMHQHPRDAK
jgi:hypothetical protein